MQKDTPKISAIGDDYLTVNEIETLELARKPT